MKCLRLFGRHRFSLAILALLASGSSQAIADAQFTMRCFNPQWEGITFTSDGNSGQMITPTMQFNINQDATKDSTIFVGEGTAGICEVTITSEHIFTGSGASVLVSEEQEFKAGVPQPAPFSRVLVTQLGNKTMRYQVDKTYQGNSWKSSTIRRFTAGYRPE